MCGLFGAPNKQRFKLLAEANQKRGFNAWSIIVLNNSGEVVEGYDGKGRFPLMFVDTIPDGDYYIGHVQTRTNPKASIHPACLPTKYSGGDITYDCHMLWHNGILLPAYTGKVRWDTSYLLEAIVKKNLPYNAYMDTHQIYNNYLSQELATVKGSFACVLYTSGDCYVRFFRNSDSPMFMNLHGEYSSVRFDDMVSVPVGKIHTLNFRLGVLLVDQDNTFIGHDTYGEYNANNT